MEDLTETNETNPWKFSFGAFKGFFKLSIVQNSGIYIVGNSLQKVIIFLLLPVYTYYLSPNDFGITGLATTIESILVILFGFGLRSSIARYYFDFSENKERLKQYISISFIFITVAACLLTVILQIFGEKIWLNLTSGQIPFYPYIVMVLWSAYSMIIVNFVTTLYQTQQNARAFVVAQIATVLLNIGFTIFFLVIIRYGALGLLIGRLLSTVIMALILSINLLNDWFTIKVRLSDIKSSLVFGFPLIFHSLFAWALGSIDRLMLEPHIPLSEIGFYNLGYQIGGVLTALLISINQAWIPYYYSIVKEDVIAAKQRIQQITEIYIVLFGFICLLGMLFCNEILQIISAPQYQKAAIYVPIILFSALFNGYYFMASAPIFYMKKTIWIPIMTGTAAFLNIGLNLLWIPRFGALGSAWATLISYTALAIISFLLGQRLLAIQLPVSKLLILNTILASSMYFSTYGTMVGFWNFGIKSVFLVCYLLVVYFGFMKSGHVLSHKIIDPGNDNFQTGD